MRTRVHGRQGTWAHLQAGAGTLVRVDRKFLRGLEHGHKLPGEIDGRSDVIGAATHTSGELTLTLPRVTISNFSCSLTRNITWHSMKNLDFHSLRRWKTITLTILLYLTYTSLFKKVGRMYFLHLGVKGLSLTPGWQGTFRSPKLSLCHLFSGQLGAIHWHKCSPLTPPRSAVPRFLQTPTWTPGFARRRVLPRWTARSCHPRLFGSDDKGHRFNQSVNKWMNELVNERTSKPASQRFRRPQRFGSNDKRAPAQSISQWMDERTNQPATAFVVHNFSALTITGHRHWNVSESTGCKYSVI